MGTPVRDLEADTESDRTPTTPSSRPKPCCTSAPASVQARPTSVAPDPDDVRARRQHAGSNDVRPSVGTTFAACSAASETGPSPVDQAITAYRGALEQKPEWAHGWIELGILVRESSSSAGGEIFETALALARESGDRAIEAVALLELGKALVARLLTIRQVLREDAQWDAIFEADEVYRQAAALHQKLGDTQLYDETQRERSRLWSIGVSQPGSDSASTASSPAFAPFRDNRSTPFCLLSIPELALHR